MTRAYGGVAELSGRPAPHHVAAVDGVVARYAEDGAYVALLLVGSLAHGLGRPGSDVDVVLVATEGVASRTASPTGSPSCWPVPPSVPPGA